MGTEIITASAGVEVALNYPSSVPSTIARAALPVAVKVLNDMVAAGYSLSNNVHRIKIESAVQKAFVTEWGRIMREDVIPVASTSRAYQDGRNMIRGMNLDNDLEGKAMAQLEKRLSRRWG